MVDLVVRFEGSVAEQGIGKSEVADGVAGRVVGSVRSHLVECYGLRSG